MCPLKKIEISGTKSEKGKDIEQEEEPRETQYVFTDEDSHIKYWFPVLTGFSEIVSHPHIDVRTMCVASLKY